MKRLIHSTENTEELEYIEAMSTINPQLCEQSKILVEVEERNEGPIPHTHVYHDHTRNPKKCSYIRLDKAEYSDHHDKLSIPLPDKKAKADFIRIMNSDWPKYLCKTPDGDVRYKTGYEAAVDTWVDCYEKGSYDKFNLDDEGQLIMPDYSKL